LYNVEVLLVQGEWDAVDDDLWNIDNLRVVLRFSDKSTRGKRGGSNKRSRFAQNAASSGVSEGWRMGILPLEHNAVGGVTSGHFRIEWAVRDGAPSVKFFFPPTMDATLGQVLSEKDSSGINVPRLSEGEANTSKGTLESKRRHHPVVVKNQWGLNEWIRIPLSSKELA